MASGVFSRDTQTTSQQPSRFVAAGILSTCQRTVQDANAASRMNFRPMAYEKRPTCQSGPSMEATIIPCPWLKPQFWCKHSVMRVTKIASSQSIRVLDTSLHGKRLITTLTHGNGCSPSNAIEINQNLSPRTLVSDFCTRWSNRHPASVLLYLRWD